MNTTNKKSSQFVSEKRDFRASNLTGFWWGKNYIVSSYKWFPLFIYSSEENIWYENKDRYSVSTSKQRTQCHPRCETIMLSLEEMKEKAEGKRRMS